MNPSSEPLSPEDKSPFDPNVMRSGIPIKLKSVASPQDTTDLVYRNVDVMSTNSLRHAAGADYNSPVLQRTIDMKPPQRDTLQVSSLYTTPLTSIPLENTKFVTPQLGLNKVTGKYQICLTNCSVQNAKHTIESFLSAQSITSKHRLEASVNCWDCHTISTSCQLVKFRIQSECVSITNNDINNNYTGSNGSVIDSGSSVYVDFKRERGCCDALQSTFNSFKTMTNATTGSTSDLTDTSCATSGAVSGKGRRKFLAKPPPLPDDDDDIASPSCSAIAEALTAMSSWIESSPLEALQSLGQLYGNKCQHLLKSENILGDVCRAIQKHSADSSDLLALTLAMACLRRILSIYSEMKVSSPMTDDLVGMVAEGLRRGTETKCLTANREAALCLAAMNSTTKLN